MPEPDNLEIDIGKYIEVLFRQWQLILGLGLFFGLIAGVMILRQAKVYNASVLVASAKTASSVSFETAIETLTEEQLGYRLVGTATRLQSYVQMVRNPLIAQKVIETLGDQLPESERDIVKLMNRVQGALVEKSDSIEIKVTHRDPELAAAIANAWGEAYVEHVNYVYSGGGVSESYLAVQQQTEEAREAYEKAQADLVAFIANNQIGELTRQITEQQAMIDNLSEARSLMVSSIISDTMISQLTVYDQKVQDLQEKLSQAYYDSRKVGQWLHDAQDMRDQVLNGGPGAAASNSLALNLLKAQVFTSFGPEEGVSNLQIQTSPVSLSPEEMVADLDSLIRTLEARLNNISIEIRALSQQLLESESGNLASGLNTAEEGNLPLVESQATIKSFSDLKGLDGVLVLDAGETSLEQRIQELEVEVSKLEAHTAAEVDREQELTRARDLAWETYSTLATKAAELRVAAETRGTEVVLAVPAAVPVNASSRGIRDISLAAAIGIILGIGAAFGTEFWWQYRGVKPKPISPVHLLRKS